jgi:hypothetical protein
MEYKSKLKGEGNMIVLIIRGRVCKYVTNGSKAAVMDVICFLCVSLGSSTVQLHDSLGSQFILGNDLLRENRSK